MNNLTISTQYRTNTTIIENKFIDKYMPKANGEFVKVYLYLLRCVRNIAAPITLSHIADFLDNTEKDILRALKYWEKEGLLVILYNENHEITGIDITTLSADNIDSTSNAQVTNTGALPTGAISPMSATAVMQVSQMGQPTSTMQASQMGQPASTMQASPIYSTSTVASPVVLGQTAVAIPHYEVQSIEAQSHTAHIKKPSETVSKIANIKSRKEFKQLLFMTEQYLGKTLSKSDVDMISYFYDSLHFPIDLIEFLIEYCVENGHKSMHYIQSVALAWSDHSILSVAAAKEQISSYCKEYFSVLKAFGITGRNPVTTEKQFINKWTDELGFSMELICEACTRTIAAIQTPKFGYADSILMNWKKQNVHHLSDLIKIDEAHMERQKGKKKATGQVSPVAKNAFTNFEQRDYNLNSLEAQLLNKK